MFIAAVGKEADFIAMQLQRVATAGGPQERAVARRIIDRARNNHVLDNQITDGTAFVVGKTGVRHIDHYLAECGSHG